MNTATGLCNPVYARLHGGHFPPFRQIAQGAQNGPKHDFFLQRARAGSLCGHRSTMLATSTCLGATTVPDFPLRSPCPTFEMACHGACRAVLRRVPVQRKVECPCREARSGWHQLSLGRHLRSVEMVSVDAERRRSVGFHWGGLYHKSQASPTPPASRCDLHRPN